MKFKKISEALAKESGFASVSDLIKTALHGGGRIVYFIRFNYEEPNN